MHAEQAARRAQHEIAERVPVGVVVELEPIVVDELDAEAVAAVLLAQRSQQALFAHLAPIEQRAAVAAHPAQQRLALFQLHAFLPQLFEDVQKHLIPVLDLVADRELERLEARADEIQLGVGELQHPGNIVEQIADRPGELGLGGDLRGPEVMDAAEELVDLRPVLIAPRLVLPRVEASVSATRWLCSEPIRAS